MSLTWPVNLLFRWRPLRRRRIPAAAVVAPLDANHAARLAAIHAAAFARPWGSLEFERLLADRFVLADGVFLSPTSEPCGFVISRRVLEEAEILTVALASEARGRRLSRPLLVRHLEELTRRGIRSVHLEVEEGNLPALALYRSLGFREIGRRTGYYLRSDGSRAAALTMSLAI